MHLLGYIMYNKNLGLNYYDDMKYAHLSDLLIQANTKTGVQLMAFSDSSCRDCPDTGRSTGEYNIFYQGGTIYHDTHVLVPVAQSSAESEYNVACTAGIALSHFVMLINELLNKDPDISPKEAPKYIVYQICCFCV